MAASDDESFFALLAARDPPSARTRWYMSAFACLTALNYPDKVASLYQSVLGSYIPKDDAFEETKKICEAITKLVGIIGAARVW
jgi:hypothetical protein